MNISKLLMVTLMVVSAVIIAQLNDNPDGKDGAGDRDRASWGEFSGGVHERVQKL